jgi:hypothetical protein
MLLSLQVVFVPDDVAAIASEAASLSATNAAVITSMLRLAQTYFSALLPCLIHCRLFVPDDVSAIASGVALQASHVPQSSSKLLLPVLLPNPLFCCCINNTAGCVCA